MGCAEYSRRALKCSSFIFELEKSTRKPNMCWFLCLLSLSSRPCLSLT